MEETKNFNVLIRDGDKKTANRFVNWDFSDQTTVFECLRKFKWSWKHNSVKVNGKPLKDDQLNISLIDIMQETRPGWKYGDRVTITMRPVPIKPTTAPKPGAEGAVSNVH